MWLFHAEGPFPPLSPPLPWEPLLRPHWRGPATTRYSCPGEWSHIGLPPGAGAFRALSLPVEREAPLLIVSNIRASGPHKARPVSRQRMGPVLQGQYKKRTLFCFTETYEAQDLRGQLEILVLKVHCTSYKLKTKRHLYSSKPFTYILFSFPPSRPTTEAAGTLHSSFHLSILSASVYQAASWSWHQTRSFRQRRPSPGNDRAARGQGWWSLVHGVAWELHRVGGSGAPDPAQGSGQIS